MPAKRSDEDRQRPYLAAAIWSRRTDVAQRILELAGEGIKSLVAEIGYMYIAAGVLQIVEQVLPVALKPPQDPALLAVLAIRKHRVTVEQGPAGEVIGPRRFTEVLAVFFIIRAQVIVERMK